MKPKLANKYEDTAPIKSLFETDPDQARTVYSELFYYYNGIINTPVAQSQHPAGIIASPINLIDCCGKFVGREGQEIVPLDMDCCHDIGLIKYDILGLKTIGVIDKICKMIGQYFPKAEEINFDDQAVYEDMNKDPLTIFQFESSYAAECFKKMGCHSIDDITLVNAALRPGGASYRDKLFAHEINDNGSELINNILKDSYGYLVYQEQVTAFLQYVCGFSGSDADSMRRNIAKKNLDKITAAMPKVLEGYCSKSDKPREVAEEEAKQFLKVIEDASSYMFNKNHALGYSLLTYLCGYYRYYYPVEYCTSFISCAKNKDDFNNGRALANSLGIKVEDIKFRQSTWDYRCDPSKRTIYKGLFGVAYMNKNAAEALYSFRDIEFKDFGDLLEQAVLCKIDVRQLSILVKLNFFEEFGGIKYLLRIIEVFKDFKNRKHRAELVKNKIQGFRSRPSTDIEIIDYEYEATATISRIYPKMDKGCYYVVDKQGRLGSLYQLATGRIFKIKFVNKKIFDKGMMVRIISTKEDRRWYMDNNGKWKQYLDKFEPIISEFSVLNDKQDEN